MSSQFFTELIFCFGNRTFSKLPVEVDVINVSTHIVSINRNFTVLLQHNTLSLGISLKWLTVRILYLLLNMYSNNSAAFFSISVDLKLN